MIVLRRLGGGVFALNPDLVERVEETPDTVVSLVDGKKFLVEESLVEVLGLIVDYRALVVVRSSELGVGCEGGRRVLRVVPSEHVVLPGVVEGLGDGVGDGFGALGVVEGTGDGDGGGW